MKRFLLITTTALAFSSFIACNEAEHSSVPLPAADTMSLKEPVTTVFNADSAYALVAAQLAFGPRTPGSAAQQQCAAWMQQQLTKWCDTVYRQETTVTGWDGKKLPCINLVGTINPSAQRRILLLAHWDSRPWADNDVKDKNKPIPGADDGASGVAVLLELARILKSDALAPELGIDLLLTDVEDYGKSEGDDENDSYCLGTQYWARNPHVAGYKAEYGILLDMVGGRNARFPLEASSTRYAGRVQQQVWETANKAGYSSYFPFVAGGDVTDDHVYVNELAHIPTIDIISLTDDTPTGFPAHWHTHNDNLSVIDRNTLKAVGQTLLQVIRDAASSTP
jgi:glutaminyl-peptide cyclotransferase